MASCMLKKSEKKIPHREKGTRMRVSFCYRAIQVAGSAGGKFFGWGVVSLGKITYNVVLRLKIITHGNGSFGLRNMPRQRGKMKEIKDDFYHGQQTVSGICFG